MFSIFPQPINESYYSISYEIEDLDKFYSEIKFASGDLSGKTLYIQDTTLPQSKLRECGFKITRDKSKADVIIIKDARKTAYYKSAYNYTFRYDQYLKKFISDMIYEQYNNYSYCYDSQLYRYLYKYEGNLELFNNLNDLLISNDKDNIKLAMEMMTNANWEGNYIYVAELCSNYWWNRMRYSNYKTSISWKGFVTSLSFDPTRINFSCAQDYKDWCLNDEHHQFVFNKYDSLFQESLKALVSKYKVIIKDIKYEIDTTKLEEAEEDCQV